MLFKQHVQLEGLYNEAKYFHDELINPEKDTLTLAMIDRPTLREEIRKRNLYLALIGMRIGVDEFNAYAGYSVPILNCLDFENLEDSLDLEHCYFYSKTTYLWYNERGRKSFFFLLVYHISSICNQLKFLSKRL